MTAGAACDRDGVGILSFSIDKDSAPGRKAEAGAAGPMESPGTGSGKKHKRGPAPGVGNALRAAYDQTLNEDIPPEMLDLLGKLG